jgi:hypothetical protein
MSDAVTAKLLNLAKRAHGTVQVGFIDNDQAPIAFWNEYGHKGRFPAPARPFFRTMVANESGKWPEMMGQMLRSTKMDGKKTLAFMGEEIEGSLKQSIIDLTSPPLSPVTLRLRLKFGNQPQNIRLHDVYSAIGDVRRGAKVASGAQAKPLIWTGDMLNSTSYKVSA